MAAASKTLIFKQYNTYVAKKIRKDLKKKMLKDLARGENVESLPSLETTIKSMN